MANDNKELVSSMLRKMTKLNYIKPGDVPGINLYMDQVTTFMDEHLSDSKRHEDDKILTKTMINNYAKNQLIPPPEKKKYTKKQGKTLKLLEKTDRMLIIGKFIGGLRQ